MSNVINLADYRPHAAGEAFCTGCGHNWVATAPLGVTQLRCPQCTASKGLWKYPFIPEDPVWTCHCGSQLFYITEELILCRECGLPQDCR